MASFLTGGTVVAVAHKDGVLMAADTVLNYGSTRRTDNYERIIPVGTHTLIGFTGDEADFKDSLYTLKSMHREARCHGTPPPSTREIHGFLATRNYSSRLEMDPIYNGYIIGGCEPGESPYIGVVDLRGTQFTASFFATGMGRHYALPVLREGWKPGISKDEAVALLLESLKTLAFNDAAAGSSFIICEATSDGTHIGPVQTLDLDWSSAAYKDSAVN
ncbi:Proteasome subunit beta type 4 [Giardia duodenalis]|uniref:Proteasome subunit beta n=1 Tax=Giardia intestinalis (strain ATCC 50803 / WB clone C6) TaxID=184922 RepID=A8BII2_GIAIC|nr:Proteasome subunit beta type 4 [Giardia intestinalis]KAE8305634.1 Proteasome subunit beta type 4 [Giardia intestinalis]|eukprot:XP_001706845.1 Proteasome subunit beta type 4 precursor [Giardia lamblia ATCC 50803]